MLQLADGTRKVYADLTRARIAAVKHDTVVLVWDTSARAWAPL